MFELAFVNINRYGIEKPIITQSVISQNTNTPTEIHYSMKMWGKTYERDITLYNS